MWDRAQMSKPFKSTEPKTDEYYPRDWVKSGNFDPYSNVGLFLNGTGFIVSIRKKKKEKKNLSKNKIFWEDKSNCLQYKNVI